MSDQCEHAAAECAAACALGGAASSAEVAAAVVGAPICAGGGAASSAGEAPCEAPVRLAVFDYDGTIISGQSGSLFSRYLLARHLISARTLGRLFWWGTRYTLHLPFRQDESRELIFRDIGIHGQDEARRIMRDFHAGVLSSRYRSDAVAEVRRRHDEGCVTLLISATFREIARIAADSLGMDGFVATTMETDEAGEYTGRVEGEVVVGEGKVRAVEDWANEHLGEGRWRIAYAYGDHFTDAPLFERADECFAVRPGATLWALAHRRGWPVLAWR